MIRYGDTGDNDRCNHILEAEKADAVSENVKQVATLEWLNDRLSGIAYVDQANTWGELQMYNAPLQTNQVHIKPIKKVASHIVEGTKVTATTYNGKWLRLLKFRHSDSFNDGYLIFRIKGGRTQASPQSTLGGSVGGCYAKVCLCFRDRFRPLTLMEYGGALPVCIGRVATTSEKALAMKCTITTDANGVDWTEVWVAYTDNRLMLDIDDYYRLHNFGVASGKIEGVGIGNTTDLIPVLRDISDHLQNGDSKTIYLDLETESDTEPTGSKTISKPYLNLPTYLQ